MNRLKMKNVPTDQNHMMDVAKLLANKTSISILRNLHKAGMGMQYSIIQECDLTQPTCSKHLRALCDVGLVTKEVFRTTRLYSVSKDGFKRCGLSYRIWLAPAP